MALRRPQPGDKVTFFTKRALGDKGKITIWKLESDSQYSIEYICPHCGKSGEKQETLERQKVSQKNPETGKRKTIKAFIIKCDSCGKDIIIEQWAKAGPGKKKAA
jgi:predicted RNA-binding Zn-ribbon protein involved in translation (DUF1610 family)